MTAERDFTKAREAMVDRQLRGRGIADPEILRAFLKVPREAFVEPDHAHLAYEDHPLPIAAGQTISQPYIVALMIEAAGIRPGHRVLEVGAGSGYAAAVIGRIADSVIGIERHSELAAAAAQRMARLGYSNVRIVEGDGTLGRPDEAPFDAILCSASGTRVPKALTDQLDKRGTLVMPLGGPGSIQELVRIRRTDDGRIHRETLCPVRFVPLIGADDGTG